MLQTLLRFVHRLPLCNFKDIYTLYICSVTFLNVNVTTKYISVLTRVHATNLTTTMQECLGHFSNICIFCLYAVPGEHFYIFSFFNINVGRPHFLSSSNSCANSNQGNRRLLHTFCQFLDLWPWPEVQCHQRSIGILQSCLVLCTASVQ